jgi:hypothetical protein
LSWAPCTVGTTVLDIECFFPDTDWNTVWARAYQKSLHTLRKHTSKTSVFYHSVDEVFTLLCYCAVYVGSCLLTFQDSLLVPSSKVKQSEKNAWPLKKGLTGCPKTPVNKYPLTLRNNPEEQRPQNKPGSHILPLHYKNLDHFISVGSNFAPVVVEYSSYLCEPGRHGQYELSASGTN